MEFLVALTPLAIFPAGTDTIFILCLIVLPALLVFFTAQYMMKQHITNSVQLVKTEILKTNLNTFTPLKLQAYERIALFLERTSIPALIQSYAQAGQSGRRVGRHPRHQRRI
jgi:predicted Kef-type K+ transport protein